MDTNEVDTCAFFIHSTVCKEHRQRIYFLSQMNIYYNKILLEHRLILTSPTFCRWAPGEAEIRSWPSHLLTNRFGLELVALCSAAALWLFNKNKTPAAPSGLSSASLLRVRVPERHFHSLSCLSLLFFFLQRTVAQVGEEGGRQKFCSCSLLTGCAAKQKILLATRGFKRI